MSTSFDIMKMVISMNLIISDADKTLLPAFEPNLSEEVVGVINETRKKDKFCLSTGRVLGNVYHMNQKYDFLDYIIASNGSVIYDVKSKTVIAHKEIPRDYVNKIIELTQNKFYKFNLCTLTNWYRCENRSDDVLFAETKKIDNLYDVSNKEKVYKCEIYYDDMNDLITLYKELTALNLPLEFSIMESKEENHYIDITSKGINKSNAVKFLKNLIQAEKTIAFGDHMNDFEMLKNADISVSVANAVEALKANSTYVTDSVENNGVTNWLKNHYLNQSI